MSFSINTNVASLQAQNYLRTNSDFQGKTINRVTSGLRIVQSGDDAAGLAIANGFRSDEAVLTQGIRNANDGLSQLQIVDGGLNNISQLLDRARTLATQSATGTFTGDRTVLNAEFQNVLGEVDRQSQAIGLNTNGTFAKNLSVFIGGGKTSSGISNITNGSVGLDLSQATVDAKSLGLKGVQSIGVALTDIGSAGTNATSGSATSVTSIVQNATNTASEAVQGSTVFYVNGPGFSGNNKVGVSVNLSGVTDTGTLVSAINNAIQSAGNGGTQSATALKNANVTASINVDASGKSQLTFNASGTAFQVEAGDRVSNALLGNFKASTNDSTGKDLSNVATAAGNVTAATTLAANTIVRIQGSGLAAPVDIQLASGLTTAQALTSLSSQVANNAGLQAAGISLTTAVAGSPLAFTSSRGEQFTVAAAGDNTNVLGLGTFQLASAASTTYDYSTVTGAAISAPTVNGNTDKLEFSIGGGAGVAVNVIGATTDITSQLLANKVNAAIQTVIAGGGAGATALATAQITASVSGTSIVLSSSNGSNFRVTSTSNGGTGTDHFLGFGAGVAVLNGANSAAASVATDNTDVNHFDAGGASASKTFGFSAIAYGSDTQTLNLTAEDASGSGHNSAIVLTKSNARSLDEAISTINTTLQRTNDTTLQKIVAVKEYDGTAHTEGIKFISSLQSFNVGVGSVGSGAGIGFGDSPATQGSVLTSTVSGGGSTSDISNQSTAQAAVTALSNAVATLGRSQATVGRGENQFAYAVNLAQSQLTNTATAESRIRDADLASEAANLTKAQVLLQAGVAALAQANSAPQQVLSLLRG